MQSRFHFWQGAPLLTIPSSFTASPFIASIGIAAALVLSGCGSTPPASNSTADAAKRSSAKGRNAFGLPRAGSGRGGYYMDDGPGDDIPEGLMDTPDAEPKVEPYLPNANRPYVVFGRTYTPITNDKPFKQRGIGSWYGKKFHGQRTSSGELYDMYKMTAAHPTLPIPSYARVTNLSNGNQVIVRVNDRGPFVSNRIIDLSFTAALKLGYLGKGSGELEVERLLPDDIARINENRQTKQIADAPQQAQRSSSNAVPLEAVREINDAVGPASVSFVAGTAPAVVTAAGGFYLQLGAYSQVANAEAARARLAKTWAAELPPPEVEQSGPPFRLYSGPFATRSEAEAAAKRASTSRGAKPVIVQR